MSLKTFRPPFRPVAPLNAFNQPSTFPDASRDALFCSSSRSVVFRSIGMLSLIVLLIGAPLLGGCKPPADPVAQKDEKEKSPSGIFGKSTQDIGEYDPDAGAEVSDGKMKQPSALNPLGALNAYKPAIEKISRMQILQAVNLFQAEFGRYPKDYDEFMEKIIKRNGIKLPVLPGDWKYQYDVANHELLIVKEKSDDE